MAKKEVWQMTTSEYIQSLKGIKIRRAPTYNRYGTIVHEHQNSVAHAIQLGKPVPRKVILEFRQKSPSEARQLLDIPQGKYAPRVARFR